MAVYNTNENYLLDAINSILGQTYQNIELIIIDDCSTYECTISVLHSIVDKRVKIIRNDSNIGLTKSLNIGMRHCSGDYIARLDSDDMADKDRIKMQLKYIQEKEYSVIGCGFDFLPFRPYKRFITEDIRKQRVRMLFGNAGIIHSSAFFSRKVFEENNIKYNEKYKRSQDYALWCECVHKKLAIGYHPEILVKWRESESQISRKYENQQLEDREKIRECYIREEFNVDDKLVNVFRTYINDRLYEKSDVNVELIEKSIYRFIELNETVPLLDEEMVRYWFFQSVMRVKYLKRVDFLFSSLFRRAITPKYFRYILVSIKTEKVCRKKNE